MNVLSMSLKDGFQQGGDSTSQNSGFAGNFTGFCDRRNPPANCGRPPASRGPGGKRFP
jgi:hypothetical protein